MSGLVATGAGTASNTFGYPARTRVIRAHGARAIGATSRITAGIGFPDIGVKGLRLAASG